MEVLTRSSIWSHIIVPKLRTIASEEGKDRIFPSAVLQSGEVAEIFVGSLAAAKHQMPAAPECVESSVICRRPLDIHTVDAFDADSRHCS